MADRLGDPTAREAGRLTLNPIPHIDPFFTILLPGLLILWGSGFVFGGAKPVPVNVSWLRHPRRDWALVGAAGPLMNIVIAVLLCAVLSLLVHTSVLGLGSAGAEVLAVGTFVNVLLAVFNLVPIPPLDGSRVAQYVLSGQALMFYRRLERFGLLLIVMLGPLRSTKSRSSCLAVSKLPALTWCDLGSPTRVVKTVTRLGLTPAWIEKVVTAWGAWRMTSGGWNRSA